MVDEINLNKLAWRARRGTKELDTVLQHFLANHFVGLSREQQQDFSLLLEQPDPDISDWLNQYSQPAHLGLQKMISLIQANYKT